MKNKNSLLDTTRESLNDEQITDCFARFKEAVSGPNITTHVTEACRNMKTVKSTSVGTINYETCSGGSNATFNNKNINKFDQVLVNIQELFDKDKLTKEELHGMLMNIRKIIK